MSLRERERERERERVREREREKIILYYREREVEREREVSLRQTQTQKKVGGGGGGSDKTKKKKKTTTHIPVNTPPHFCHRHTFVRPCNTSSRSDIKFSLSWQLTYTTHTSPTFPPSQKCCSTSVHSVAGLSSERVLTSLNERNLHAAMRERLREAGWAGWGAGSRKRRRSQKKGEVTGRCCLLPRKGLTPHSSVCLVSSPHVISTSDPGRS